MLAISRNRCCYKFNPYPFKILNQINIPIGRSWVFDEPAGTLAGFDVSSSASKMTIKIKLGVFITLPKCYYRGTVRIQK